MTLKLEGATRADQRLYLFASTRPHIDAEDQHVTAEVTLPEGRTEKVTVDYSTDPPTITPASAHLNEADEDADAS